MTKVRPPLSFENALTRVAGSIGWDNVARICGQAENTVRNWSDPDTMSGIRLDAALALDLAYLAAAGDCAPFLLCYATRVNAGTADVTGDRQALLEGAARAARESGEAVAATLAAAHPMATAADIAIAERELEEAIEAKTGILAILRGIKSAFMRTRGSGAELERGPEVPPPTVSA